MFHRGFYCFYVYNPIQPKMLYIVPATSARALAIQKLLKVTWKDAYGDHLSRETLDEVYKKWQNTDFLIKQIKNTSMYFPLAMSRKRVVGLATAHMVTNCVVLFRLFVHPQHQRKGIGTKLLDDIISHFPDSDKIQLYVETLNIKARDFYLKHGFVEIQREPEKIGNQIVEQVLLEKNLNK